MSHQDQIDNQIDSLVGKLVDFKKGELSWGDLFDALNDGIEVFYALHRQAPKKRLQVKPG